VGRAAGWVVEKRRAQQAKVGGARVAKEFAWLLGRYEETYPGCVAGETIYAERTRPLTPPCWRLARVGMLARVLTRAHHKKTKKRYLRERAVTGSPV
jgi:hypothetical protein